MNFTRTIHRRRGLRLLAAAVLSLSSARAEWRMEVLPDEWQLAGFENSLDLSGIGAANSLQVLVGSDEMFHIQPGTIDKAKHRIDSRRPIALPLESKGGKLEVDIEGVAFSPGEQAYFVVGSHGLGRKKGDFKPDRHSVYRVPVDPESGEVRKEGIRRTSLLPWLEKTPLLAPHVKQPLQQNGLNIEGLAWSNGKLLFGLRAPNKDGRGLVIELATGELFGGTPGELKVHDLPVAKGRGIREIAAVRGGFILITGNASAEASKKIPVSAAPGPDTRFDLMFWNGRDSAVMKIGQLPENGGKGEALLVLDDAPSHLDLLVVFDGLPGGEPMSLRLHR